MHAALTPCPHAPCAPRPYASALMPSPSPSQIRQRKFQMHNKEWLEVIDEDEAEEYAKPVS